MSAEPCQVLRDSSSLEAFHKARRLPGIVQSTMGAELYQPQLHSHIDFIIAATMLLLKAHAMPSKRGLLVLHSRQRSGLFTVCLNILNCGHKG